MPGTCKTGGTCVLYGRLISSLPANSPPQRNSHHYASPEGKRPDPARYADGMRGGRDQASNVLRPFFADLFRDELVIAYARDGVCAGGSGF